MAPAITHPLVRDRVFWRLVGTAVGLGLAAGALSLGFVAVVGFGTDLWWPDDPDYGLLEGEAWWLLVTTGAGLLVGLVRLVTTVPKKATGALAEVATLSAGLLLAVLVVKILTFSISMATGFIGGPVMPSLFLGGIAGIAVHVLIPDLPLALTLSTMLVAVPGAVVKAPFTMMALAAITVSVGPITVAPAGIAVITAYLLTSGLELFDSPKSQPSPDEAQPDQS